MLTLNFENYQGHIQKSTTTFDTIQKQKQKQKQIDGFIYLLPDTFRDYPRFTVGALSMPLKYNILTFLMGRYNVCRL